MRLTPVHRPTKLIRKDCGEHQEGRVWPQRKRSRLNLLRNLGGAASEWESATLDTISKSGKRAFQAESRAGAKVLGWQREKQFRRTKGCPDDLVQGMSQQLE